MLHASSAGSLRVVGVSQLESASLRCDFLSVMVLGNGLVNVSRALNEHAPACRSLEKHFSQLAKGIYCAGWSPHQSGWRRALAAKSYRSIARIRRSDDTHPRTHRVPQYCHRQERVLPGGG